MRLISEPYNPLLESLLAEEIAHFGFLGGLLANKSSQTRSLK
jgi:hypothetical protein